MKKIKYFFPFLLLFIFIFSLSVNAEETEDTSDLVMCDSAFEIGDSAYLYVELMTNVNDWKYTFILDKEITSEEESRICIYVDSDNRLQMHNAPSGIRYGQQVGTDNTSEMEYWFGNRGWVPLGYANTENFYTEMYGFVTNIPFFSSYEDALVYINGDDSAVKSALNYKKTFENGSWVKPFEDIEINDREIPVPELCNITHSSFSVSNNVDEKYLVEVYLDSGLQNPYYALDAMTYNSIDDPFYVNSFGLITDRSEAYWNGPDFDVFALWQVDNCSALLESVNSFYTRFPTAMSWYTAEDVQTTGVFSNFDKTAYGIWGAPFGDKYGLWGNISKVTAEDLATVDIDDVPLCFTHYRVRYWYYDDDSGYHYGPWASVVYFSDGKVVINSIFQDDDGNIIESGTESGRQDGNGILNITDKFGSLDLGSSDNLFAYINSLFTNLKYVAGNFSIVFASVFSFLPEDVRHMIYLGMGSIIVIAIIKALRG